MRIQNINQNNYQNNRPKKNIGFKMNSCVVLEGFKSEYAKLEGTTLETVQKAIKEVLRQFNRTQKGEKITVLQDNENLSKFWVIDADTIEKAQKNATDKGNNQIGIELPDNVKTYIFNWTDLRKILPN